MPPSAGVKASKSHSGRLTQGGTGSDSITVSTVGTAPTSGAVSMTDTIPTGLMAPSLFFKDTATTEIYTLSLHDALPISAGASYPAITLAVSVAANAPASVTNTATVAG